MKIAVSSLGQGLDASLDQRFGRAEGFIIFDLETGRYSHLDNTQNTSDQSMAGIKTARSVADSGAQAVITGHIGPNAYAILEAEGIEVYLCGPAQIDEVIHKFKDGTLPRAEAADTSVHKRT
jgi:predicted Fe-Mo cluster-binding NifX family protein